MIAFIGGVSQSDTRDGREKLTSLLKFLKDETN
jgi:hypothetical protein